MGNVLSWLASFVMGGKLSLEQLSTRHVVIIGGGYAGMEMAVQLKKMDIPFTLIDPKDFFYHYVGGLRAIIDPDYAKRTMIPYAPTFGTRFVQGNVTDVDFKKKTVTVDSRAEPIEFTDLVFAVGSTGPFFAKPENTSKEAALAYLKELHDEVDKASNIVIIGGGAVGIELAGEIAEKYFTKKVSIIHSQALLASTRHGDGFQGKLKAGLESLKVELHLEERVTNIDDLKLGKYGKQIVKTSKGNSYECDLVIKSIGLPPQTNLTSKVLDDSKFDEFRRLRVTPFLELEGETNVYAIGDCCNTPEDKMAAHCPVHASSVANNILRSMKGQEKVAYKQAFSGMLVTLGTKAGVGIINGWNFPSFLVALVKGRNMFSSKYWGAMGQPEPS